MHPLRKQRLIWIVLITFLLGAAVALALYALRQNIDLFFTPTQLAGQHLAKNQSIRVGGWVVQGSVVHKTKRLSVQFVITDHKKNVMVYYDGILPDLFREGQAVVVDGVLNPQGVLLAREVLAKHDENYTPPLLQTSPAQGDKG